MTISADSSVATVRPSRSGPPTAAEQDEGVDLEADELWAREFVRQQDKLEERQWDEWAGALVEMQDARERFGHVKGGVADEELNEVERLRLEVVEVQMRSIRWVPSGVIRESRCLTNGPSCIRCSMVRDFKVSGNDKRQNASQNTQH
jgi:hypothetical protein